MKYTLCFLRKGDELLMLNREKNPWMGRWNGVGGKIEANETSKECAVREIYEETQIRITENELFYGGNLIWYEDGKMTGGLDLFLVELPKNYSATTPLATREGILAFKKINWLLDTGNQGMPDNVPFVLNELLKREKAYQFTCYFEAGKFQSIMKKDGENLE